jgi:hypothetical protein
MTREMEERAEKAADADQRSGTPTGEFDPHYSRDDMEKTRRLGFRRGYLAGAREERARIIWMLHEALYALTGGDDYAKGMAAEHLRKELSK